MNAEVPTAPTPIELYRWGLTALQEQLGPEDSILFLHLFDPGSGITPTNAKPKPLRSRK